MKPETENEATGKAHEVAGKNKERSGALMKTHISWSSKLSPFAMGVGVGALLGLLFAPASGKKTRTYITGTVKDGLDGVASTGERWSRQAREKVDDVKANVADVVEAGQKAYRAARDA